MASARHKTSDNLSGSGHSRPGCVPTFPSPYIFHSPFVHQSLCCQSRYSPTLYSPVPIFPNPFFPPRGTPYVSQSLCFPVPLLPSPYVLQPPCSPVSIFPVNGFPSLCSPKIFPSPYVPQSPCSPGPRLNIKTVLSTYGDFHVKDKTAVRTSYL